MNWNILLHILETIHWQYVFLLVLSVSLLVLSSQYPLMGTRCAMGTRAESRIDEAQTYGKCLINSLTTSLALVQWWGTLGFP